jgi:sugar transferase (PEP-CTERM system associated)
MFRFLGQYVPIKSVTLAMSEAGLIVAGLLLASWVRLRDPGTLENFLGQPLVVLKIGTVVLVCLICFYYNDLYDLQIVSRRAELLIRLLQSLGAASLILAVLYLFAPRVTLGRDIASLAAILVAVLLTGWRLIVDVAGSLFRPANRVLIAGTGSTGVRLVREILDHPELNFKVVGFLDEKGENVGKSLVNPGIIGGAAEIETFVERERIDRVILAFAERRGCMPVSALLRVRLAGVPVEDAHLTYERIAGRIMVDMLSPSSLILSEGFRKSSALVFAKRFIDVLISVVTLVALSPLAVLIGLAIRLESPGLILIRQWRVGLGGRAFQMLKFRSMYQDAEELQPRWASQDDHRITRVGRILRPLRLDELPQCINVLRGEMSLVGPRPERPEFVSMLQEQIPYYAERHSVRPGITGWAQIKFRYGSSVEDAKTKLEYDLFYVKHLSLLLDLLVVLRTIQVVLFARGAR